MKKFSFIIPVYNCADNIVQCVKNIQRIGMEQYEIIVIDDGSTDNSGQICKRLFDKIHMVKYVYQENQGVSAARNKGLSIADGDYVIFLDVDDAIEPQKFLDLFRKLDDDPDIDLVVFGHSFDYYCKNKLYRIDEMKTPLSGIIKSSLWISKLEELYCTNSLTPIWNKIFKRDFLVKNKIYLRKDMFLYEDLEYSLRCIARCKKILFEPEIIYHYRQSENTIKRLQRVEHISDLIQHIEEAFIYFLKEKHAEEMRSVADHILLSLYLVLAREKISISDFKKIEVVCDDFTAWYYSKNFQKIKSDEIFIDDLLKHRIIKLVVERNYTMVRHRIAVKVKSSSLYKKRNNRK